VGFFFKNRNKYNGAVDSKLNEEYQIPTRDNPKFPGIIAYLGLIDQAWDGRFTEQEAAMFIATLYYSGLKREQLHNDARALASRVSIIGQQDFSLGLISMHRLSTFLAAIEKANSQ
jgi:hypothetical protein